MPELTMDQLYQSYTDEAAAKESATFRTVPKGSYNIRADKVSPQIGGPEKPEFLVGREFATLSGIITGPKGETVRLTFDVSWQVYRVNPISKKPEQITDENRDRALSEEWPQDKVSKLWGQLTTTFDAVKKPIGESLEMAKMYPFSVFVTESFETPIGWRSPKDEAELLEYKKQGYSRKNFVNSISKAK